MFPSPSVTSLRPGVSLVKEMKDIDKQLSHTELREQRRINREARKASLEKTEVGKQTKSSDILQSLRHANRSQPSSSSKSASEIPPDKHHSRGSGSSEPVIRTIPTRSGGNGGSPESKRVNALSHQTRPTNVSDIQREKETRLTSPYHMTRFGMKSTKRLK